MYAPIDLPDIDTLRRLCRYVPGTGDLFVLRRGIERQVIRASGKRYATLYLCGRVVYAHRVAWKLHYGVDAPGLIDHIDRNKSNNRIDNLRVVTVAQNNLNRAPITSMQNCKSGALPRGVFFDKKRNWFRARISDGGERRYLGYFKTADAAAQAYRDAALIRYGPPL